MSTRFDNRDVRQLASISEMLLSPFAYADVNAWRAAVNSASRDLLGADSAGFLLPTDEGPMLYSDEHDPAELSKYPDLLPPALADGRPLYARAAELRVATLAETYGVDYALYRSSMYYREYAAPNGARENVFAMVPLAATLVHPRGMAALQFWHSREGATFSTRETDALRLLYPSFRAGVQAYRQWWRHRTDLANTLDDLGQAVAMWSIDGRLLHQTVGLQSLLAATPEQERVWAACRTVALSLAHARGSARRKSSAAPVPASTAITAGRDRFTVSGALYSSCGTRTSAPVILVSVAREGSQPVSEEELRITWSLTRTEARVALLLARGLSNREIAQELGFSEATGRRHTERVMAKLDVRSRAQVGPRIAG